MSPEVAKLAYRAIVDYLGGRREEYERLVQKAMKLNGLLSCPTCGELMVSCRVGRKIKVDGLLCTSCGYVEKKGDKVVC